MRGIACGSAALRSAAPREWEDESVMVRSAKPQACEARQTIGYCEGLLQVGSPGHPSDPTRPEPAHGGPEAWEPSAPSFPRGPESNHPSANFASNYTPPPPPPPPASGPVPVEASGGFGDRDHQRKLWRNLIIALIAVGLLGWLVLWLLGLFAAYLVNWVPTEVDVALGEQNWQELAPDSARCTDPGPLAYVEELARPLVEASGSEFEFHFAVVDDAQINAFALPGGYVTVNMGLLEAAESGEEIAAVLAHEMTHVTHRHGMRAVLRRVGGLAVVSMLFGGTDLEALAWAAEGLSTQAHSRDQERDADDGGREILMAAGVDPSGMATFFERLEAEGGGLPGAAVLLSTHPNPGERAETTRAIAAAFTPTRELPDPPAELKCH